MKLPTGLAFAVLCAAQLAVPAYLIHRQQATLAQGTVYRFRTEPIDPGDPFRGAYLVLDFTAACTDRGDGARWGKGWRYATLAVDAQGYARLGHIGRARPASGDWVRVRELGWSCPDGARRLELPFNRYYLPEAIAPEAERRYWQRNPEGRRQVRESHVTVRVRNGYAALDELYLDGVPVLEYVRTR